MYVDPVSGGDPHDVHQVLGEVVGGREELVPIMVLFHDGLIFNAYLFTSPAQSRPMSSLVCHLPPDQAARAQPQSGTSSYE